MSDAKPSGGGNFAGYVCPRCHSDDVLGKHMRFGQRVIEELYCRNCQLQETADTDQPTYAAVLARWRGGDVSDQGRGA